MSTDGLINLSGVRSGDFIIFTGDDALIVSNCLGLVRQTNRETRAPECGFMVRNLDDYNKTMKLHGFRIVIQEPKRSAK